MLVVLAVHLALCVHESPSTTAVTGRRDGAQCTNEELPCAVCNAVCDEITRLTATDSSARIDLRARLDSRGQRHGKLVPLARSELLAIEILDDVCASLLQRTFLCRNLDRRPMLEASKTGCRRAKDARALDARQQRAASRACDGLIEDHEAAITRLIMAGSEPAGLRREVCDVLARLCAPTTRLVKTKQTTVVSAVWKGAEAHANVPSDVAEHNVTERRPRTPNGCTCLRIRPYTHGPVP